MVSVCCTAYNHEKYIRKCLDGFIMQQTDFKYEVIINDDASTDRTANVIREYEEKYPEIIKPIYQTENQYSRGIPIIRSIMLPKVLGKYIAFCEGDDYWTDPNKLQKQFDALEGHPECAICLHKVKMVSEDETKICGYKPEINIEPGVISSDYFASIVVNTRTLGFMQFQLSSYFCRTSLERESVREGKDFYEQFDVGDLPLLLYSSTQGDVYYLNEVMSNYRVNSIGCWNSRNSETDKLLEHYYTEMNGIKAFDELTAHVYKKDIEIRLNLYELKIALIQNKLTPRLYKKYKQVMQFYPFRSRVKMLFAAYCPALLELYYKITG